MNIDDVKRLNNLAEYFIDEGNWFGCSQIQRHCKCSYNEAARVMQLGLDDNILQLKDGEPWRVRFTNG